MKFLDPKAPLSTCKEKTCENCDTKNDLTCHFTIKHLTWFLIVAFPIFIIGGIGVYLYSWWALVIYIISLPAYFGFIEIRVMCSHCPHYAEPGTKSLTCWANYGAPKIWKYRPGPMSFWEKFIFFAGLFIVLGLPILFMLLGQLYILLIVYVVYTVFAAIMLLTLLCTKCMNFACPLNRTSKRTKEKFEEHNPSLKEAWPSKTDDK